MERWEKEPEDALEGGVCSAVPLSSSFCGRLSDVVLLGSGVSGKHKSRLIEAALLRSLGWHNPSE